MLAQRLLLGLVGVFVWGMFSHAIFCNENFVSNLLNGLANFCFFVVGQISDLVKTDDRNTSLIAASTLVTQRKPPGGGWLIIHTALALTPFMVTRAALMNAAILSVDQIE